MNGVTTKIVVSCIRWAPCHHCLAFPLDLWVFVEFLTVDKELSSAFGLRGSAKNSTAR